MEEPTTATVRIAYACFRGKGMEFPLYLRTMYRFLAILGRQPELSLAELCAVATVGGFRVLPSSRMAVILEGMVNPQELMAKLGGTIKLAEVLGEVGEEDFAKPSTIRMLIKAFPPSGKTIFGFSAYHASTVLRRQLQNTAVSIKRALKEEGRSARYIRSAEGVISSVVVAKQGLLRHGAEFIVVPNKNQLLLATTVAVQPFEEFSKRDYGRPGRNARSGMLPPKLARMMVNLSRVATEGTLLDPFCGSGTVLQEAALLGAHTLIGNDANKRAVTETTENLAWLSSATDLHPAVQLHSSDIRRLAHKLTDPVNAIVTEPFLGPPLTGNEDRGRIRSVQAQLEQLYKEAFNVFKNILVPGGRVVFVQPVFFHGGEELFLMNLDAILLNGFRILQPLPPEFVPTYVKDLTFRHTLLYHRPDQRLGREILILEKK